jgi:hypothetical protein
VESGFSLIAARVNNEPFRIPSLKFISARELIIVSKPSAFAARILSLTSFEDNFSPDLKMIK